MDALALREELVWASVFAKAFMDTPVRDSLPIEHFNNAERLANDAVMMFRTYSK